MKPKHFSLVLLLLSLLAIHCQRKEDTVVDTTPKLTKDDFKITKNSYWEYEVTDHLRHTTDTFRFTIVDENASFGIYKDLIKGTWNTSLLDTMYIVINDILLEFYRYDSTTNRLVTENAFQLPIKQNDTWMHTSSFYNVIADSIQSSTLLGVDVGFSFYIKKISHRDMGYQLIEHIYVAKNIGIIFRTVSENIAGTRLRNQMFRLLNYKIY